MLGWIALIMVSAGLTTTLRAQLRPLNRGRRTLDTLAVVPEWRFYAGASLSGASALARDMHVVVRDRDAGGRVGAWRPVLWHARRQLRHAIFNPERRSRDMLLSIAEDLADVAARDPNPLIHQSRRYLVILRHCLDAPGHGGISARQFAIVRSVGRRERSISVEFLSAWHRP